MSNKVIYPPKLQRLLRLFTLLILNRTPVGGFIRRKFLGASPFMFVEVHSPIKIVRRRGFSTSNKHLISEFTVVTTVLNEANNIEKFLRSLIEQSFKPTRIIVVDAGSVDETTDIIRDLQKNNSQIELLLAPGIGIAAGRNLGATRAESQKLLFVDAGCEYDPRFCEELVDMSEEFKLPVVTCAYKLLESNRSEESYASEFIPNWGGNLRSFLPSARGMLIDTQLFLSIGGFPSFLKNSGEDTLFGLALKTRIQEMGISLTPLIGWMGPTSNGERDMKRSYYDLGDLQNRHSFYRESKGVLFNSTRFTSLESMRVRSEVDIQRGIRGAIWVFSVDPLGLSEEVNRSIDALQRDLKILVVLIYLKHPGWDVKGRRLLELDFSRLESFSFDTVSRDFENFSRFFPPLGVYVQGRVVDSDARQAIDELLCHNQLQLQLQSLNELDFGVTTKIGPHWEIDQYE